MAERLVIDIEDGPGLMEIAEMLDVTPRIVVLRRAGQEIARIVPAMNDDPYIRRAVELDPEQARAAIRAVAGSLRGMFEDDFVEKNYRQRLVDTRSFSEE